MNLDVSILLVLLLSSASQPHPLVVENAYLVELDSQTSVTNFEQRMFTSLQRSFGIARSTITMRQTISSSLFSGVSFSVNGPHSLKAIKSIPGTKGVHPIYVVPGPDSSARALNSPMDAVIAHKLTGVDRVHEQLNNFGQGVRIAVIDSGIDYLHPALGGCFGVNCKVAFGYDLVGDRFTASYPLPVPDDDPLDNCSRTSHGTHVAGIIAANATEITEAGYVPIAPFLGVAPQATIGAYRIFGCSAGNTTSDVITAAIYRAFDDNADIIVMSIGAADAYGERSDAIAAQRVSDAGVYVVAAVGNDGAVGLHTVSSPSISSGAIAVAAVDNSYKTQFYLLTPDGEKIVYFPGVRFGGWRSIVSSTVVVNNPQSAVDDGCAGPSKDVKNAVVLFAFSSDDRCNSTVRCDLAASAGAIGCLLYNVSSITGGSSIPSGCLNRVDGRKIISIVANDSSSIFTFTNLLQFIPNPTGGRPSVFTGLGLTGDLALKPQLSGLGGEIYSTISSFTSGNQHLANAYASRSGTSMACPYVAGAFALYLSHLGNVRPRPSFSELLNRFQSNSNPVNLMANSSLLASVAQQGAGLINAFDTLTATTEIWPSELALNDTVRTKKFYTILISNVGQEATRYTVGHRGAALVTGKEEGNDQLLSTPIYSEDYATVHMWPKNFQLGPGESRQVLLQFRAPSRAKANLLPIYSGFIDVINEENGRVSHLSYAGMVGDYQQARILVRNNSNGFISGLIGSDGSYIKEGEVLDGTAKGVFSVLLVTAWPSRIVFVEVVSGRENVLPGFNPSFGLLLDSRERQLVHLTNVPRHVAAANSQSYSRYSRYLWSGLVSNVVTTESRSSLLTSRLTRGFYRLRFSALKHFGNASDPNDFDVHFSPSFFWVS